MSDALDDGERAARERLELLFGAIDRLTPDELAGIGYRPAPDKERGPLLAAVADAARRSAREALVEEARAAARGAVMTRFAAGSLHPTFVGLNWGLSQGTVESRVAIAETLADAAAAAVLEDMLDPEVAAALALDAAAITGLASGDASTGSLGRAMREPDDPELRRAPGERRTRWVAVLGMVLVVGITVGVGTVVLGAVAWWASMR
jgi:hypothetical protein